MGIVSHAHLIRGGSMLKTREDPSRESVVDEAFGLRQKPAIESASAVPIVAARYIPTCSGCFVRQSGACPGFGVKDELHRSPDRSAAHVPSQVQVFPARRTILHQREESDYVPVICSGWAASSISAPNGRKQIVSFALSGEAASLNYLFEPCPGRSIEAVSEVSCRKFRRSELRTAVMQCTSLLTALGRGLGEERERTDQLSLDLGRRSAEARIARLICSLYDRLRKKGQARDGIFDFPLRQQQLADATGLTAVHVCKILSRFRSGGLLQLDGRRLTILDERRLQELVEWD